MSAPVRIAVDDGIAYVVWTDAGPVQVRLQGKMLRDIRAGQAPRPVVGDLVTLTATGTIAELLPRRSRLARRAAGPREVEQVIAANVDIAFVATSAGVDVNARRLERYLALAHEGGVEPIVLLTKIDTCADREAELGRVVSAAQGASVLAVSVVTGEGVGEVARRVAPDRIAAILGSSGVGKSTLVNRLMGDERQRVGGLRDDGKGRHTTTRRELFALPGGGLLLDTPGMRELGLFEADEGVAEAFPEVEALAEACRFGDCGHAGEPGCAVREAVESGALAAERVASWRRLKHEPAAASRRGRRR